MNYNRAMAKVALVFFVLMAIGSLAKAQNSKPKITLAPDGFPTGRETAEGVAVDLARAQINQDSELFSNSCIGLRAIGGSAEYERFMRDAIQGMKRHALKKDAGPDTPKSIVQVFAARHLRREGPASYGYATYGFLDVMFVDVRVNRNDGKPALHRTLVIKAPDGKWYAHPAPQLSPLLSFGLDDETPSTKDFKDAYYGR